MSVAHHDPVDRADGGDFGGGADEEELVRDVEHLAGHGLLDHNIAQLLGQGDNRVPRDPGQDGGSKRRGKNLAVADDENVFAAALADVARHVERNALGVAVGRGFHLDQLGVHVVCGGLGHAGQGVGGHPVPGGDANVDAPFQGFLTQVGLRPLPGQQVDLDRVLERIHAHLAVSAQDQGANVAVLRLVDAHQLDLGLLELLAGIVELDAVDLARIHQPVNVLLEAEDRRPLRGLIATDALEQAGGVAHGVRGHVDGRALPRYELSVAPDFLIVADRHDGSSSSPRSFLTGGCPAFEARVRQPSSAETTPGL